MVRHGCSRACRKLICSSASVSRRSSAATPHAVPSSSSCSMTRALHVANSCAFTRAACCSKARRTAVRKYRFVALAVPERRQEGALGKFAHKLHVSGSGQQQRKSAAENVHCTSYPFVRIAAISLQTSRDATNHEEAIEACHALQRGADLRIFPTASGCRSRCVAGRNSETC